MEVNSLGRISLSVIDFHGLSVDVTVIPVICPTGFDTRFVVAESAVCLAGGEGAPYVLAGGRVLEHCSEYLSNGSDPL